MTGPLPPVVADAEKRRHLRAAIYATENLVAATSGPLRHRWLKHERELKAALAKLEAKLEH